MVTSEFDRPMRIWGTRPLDEPGAVIRIQVVEPSGHGVGLGVTISQQTLLDIQQGRVTVEEILTFERVTEQLRALPWPYPEGRS